MGGPNLCPVSLAFRELFPVMVHPESTEKLGPGVI